MLSARYLFCIKLFFNIFINILLFLMFFWIYISHQNDWPKDKSDIKCKKFNIIFLCCCWLNLVLILRRISKYDPRARQKAKVNMFPKVLKLSEGSSSISLYTHNVKWIKIWCHALLQSLFSLQFTQFVKVKMTLVLQKMWDLSYINHFSLENKPWIFTNSGHNSREQMVSKFKHKWQYFSFLKLHWKKLTFVVMLKKKCKDLGRQSFFL